MPFDLKPSSTLVTSSKSFLISCSSIPSPTMIIVARSFLASFNSCPFSDMAIGLVAQVCVPSESVTRMLSCAVLVLLLTQMSGRREFALELEDLTSDTCLILDRRTWTFLLRSVTCFGVLVRLLQRSKIFFRYDHVILTMMRPGPINSRNIKTISKMLRSSPPLGCALTLIRSAPRNMKANE